MEHLNHQHFLDLTLKLAKKTCKEGNHPFGAILVYNDSVLLKAANKVCEKNSPLAHAEMELLHTAFQTFSKKVIEDSILYSSTEPCAMCAGAIYWSGIKKVVYGCSTDQLFQIVKEGLYIDSKSIYENSSDPVRVLDFSQNQNFKGIHEKFW